MILAHHGGEAGLLAAAIAATTVLPGLVLVWRGRFSELGGRLRGRR